MKDGNEVHITHLNIAFARGVVEQVSADQHGMGHEVNVS